MGARPAGLSRRALWALMAMSALAMSAPARAGNANGESGPQEPLRGLYASLEATMRSGRGMPFAKRFDMVAPAIDRAFDLDTILKVSVGLRWDTFDPSTRATLSRIFRRFTIASYVANFDKYEGEQFRIQADSRPAGSDHVVRTEIVPNKGDIIRLDYVMRQEPDGWRVVDILLDGSISRVAVQRSDFRTILANGDAQALIASLQRKISDLSEGALSS